MDSTEAKDVSQASGPSVDLIQAFDLYLATIIPPVSLRSSLL